MKPTRKRSKKTVIEIALTDYHVDSFNVAVCNPTRKASRSSKDPELVTYGTDSGFPVLYNQETPVEENHPMNSANNQIVAVNGPVSGGLPQIPGVIIIRKKPRPRSEQGPVLPVAKTAK